MPAPGQTVRILFQVIIWSNLNNVRLILFRVGRTVMVLLLHVMPPKIARVPALCMRSGSFSVRWSSIIINLSVSDSVYGVFSSQACRIGNAHCVEERGEHWSNYRAFHYFQKLSFGHACAMRSCSIYVFEYKIATDRRKILHERKRYYTNTYYNRLAKQVGDRA